MTNFVPPVQTTDWEKRGGKKTPMEDEDAAAASAEADDENYNLICPPNYPPSVAEAMRQLPEKEVSFALIGSLLE